MAAADALSESDWRQQYRTRLTAITGLACSLGLLVGLGTLIIAVRAECRVRAPGTSGGGCRRRPSRSASVCGCAG